ncbi:MAG TPA: prepilin-type N-terminal cleavage/methylation domain-containing protein [Armatimonadota bacterium]|nr:prepilin-type N-terminal cleavage/methylation domain-containing protein [Armatimonadota bacterium]
MMRRSRARGFTLVEILVVILIIAVLASLLFPAFAKAQEKGRQTTCLSNQHQINMAIGVWMQEHRDTYPPAESVWNDIKVSRRILVCPSKPRMTPVGYVYSQFIADKPDSLIADPIEEIVTADGAALDHLFSKPAHIDFRHNFGFIASYCDGHVEMHHELPPMWYVELATMGEYDLLVRRTQFPTLVCMYTKTPTAQSGEYALSQALLRRMPKLAQQYRLLVRFVGCNGDDFPELEQTYAVQRLDAAAGYPAVMLTSDGREVARFSGYPKDFANLTAEDWDARADALVKKIDAALSELTKIK